jgi:hypothetical protein
MRVSSVIDPEDELIDLLGEEPRGVVDIREESATPLAVASLDDSV